MRIGLPSPLGGWRSFAGEVGIVVLGVLIALGASEFVQSREWRGRVAQARAALNHEIVLNLIEAELRINTGQCANRRMDELRLLVMNAGPDLAKPLVVTRYHTEIASWSQNVWRTLIASGVISHMPMTEMLAYAELYETITLIREEMVAEQDSISDLSVLSTLRGPFGTDLRNQLLTASARARRQNNTIVRDAHYLIDEARKMGIERGRNDPVKEARCDTLHEVVADVPQ
jgi:hypothetical protein